MGDWGDGSPVLAAAPAVEQSADLMDREQDIHFVFDSGVLRPQEPVGLREGTREVAHIRTGPEPPHSDPVPSLNDAGAWMTAQESTFAAA